MTVSHLCVNNQKNTVKKMGCGTPLCAPFERKPCKGSLEIDLDESLGQIHWCCSKCRDEGVITGWQGLIWDMTDADGLMQ